VYTIGRYRCDCERTAVLPKIPHCNSSKNVPNRPLRGRRGRFGTLLQQLECGIFERTAVACELGGQTKVVGGHRGHVRTASHWLLNGVQLPLGPVGPQRSPTVSLLVGGWAQRAVSWGTVGERSELSQCTRWPCAASTYAPFLAGLTPRARVMSTHVACLSLL